ncbi:Acetyltransferase involved in cellulose biosynthesis, CelD/BcsL family [Pseudovibrio ascidiaceicola]|uniref:Acetyltransferase involved in cellulose biosynthesis, CelD/BcsL family n=1 Tax=Pseudovibrio ascidiaceicola TaxID=285279 RepID=A0A1I4BSZ0_9HYPH|nr:GNAT family N-acetyltransferase [Pseudovibrio ascidiaceicola]SFK70991.1 Acetyltransferase involved in cellulose biosynthesis, CelD/BcsL family [Pseudovibrio ascidiaceicola]
MALPQSTSNSERSNRADCNNTLDLNKLSFQIISDTDLPKLRNDWLILEALGDGSAYHAYEWCKSWAKHVAHSERATTLIVAGYIDSKLHTLLPLALHQCHLAKTARWLGEEIFNQNTGYWSQELLQAPQAHFLRPRLVAALKAWGVDLIHLGNMACCVGDHDNPLIRLDDTTSTNAIYPFKLASPAEEFIKTKRSKGARKKHRSKLSKLQSLGTLSFTAETTKEGATTTVDAMIRQRELRQAETGIPTAFALPNYQSFVREAFTNLSQDDSPSKPVIYSLKLDDEIISTCLSLKSGKRVYCYCTSIISGELMRNSPGELLMQHVIEDMCEEGMEVFDFGLGEERFKLAWAEPEYLKDWIEPLTFKGKLAAALESLKLSFKRKLRNNERFWQLYRRVRGIFARMQR